MSYHIFSFFMIMTPSGALSVSLGSKIHIIILSYEFGMVNYHLLFRLYFFPEVSSVTNLMFI
jgi:hypothetical protein